MSAATVPTWIVQEKRYHLWWFRVKAASAAEALQFARTCGFNEPATVTRETITGEVTP